MEGQRQRCVYVTARQKKKLIELIKQNPELLPSNIRKGQYKECQKRWQNIAVECNSLAGAKKTWRQWRKTWQDLRSKTKKRNLGAYKQLPATAATINNYLTPEEQEALGIKDSPTKSESPPREETPEFVQLDQDILQDNSFNNDMEYTASISEPESPPETKVFTSERRKVKVKNNKYKSSKHSNCYFNCDALTNMEERKLQVKEDYLKFKKEYLKQKLKLIKEQTEALKSIARELSK
ncbi:uncharacterized protein LOC125231020 [Leguminivora glycinivorella]|uniref:uncharacterized protein LOC125231020 n=1 Tax=Leguminivora glycinivorella TaxID=1035111 RepID=UPI00200FA6C7|nr:uncharacterized protein LOC125231020 [Leguminivora glycinivorella]